MFLYFFFYLLEFSFLIHFVAYFFFFLRNFFQFLLKWLRCLLSSFYHASEEFISLVHCNLSGILSSSRSGWRRPIGSSIGLILLLSLKQPLVSSPLSLNLILRRPLLWLSCPLSWILQHNLSPASRTLDILINPSPEARQMENMAASQLLS